MLIISIVYILITMKKYDPEQSIGFLIHDLYRLIRQDFHRRVKHNGLTQEQWRALVHINRNEGCSQATLAALMDIRPITLSRLLDKMEQADWVERRPDPSDRRAIQLFIREKAQKMLVEMSIQALETRKKALDGLSKKQQQELFHNLNHIKENLSR